MNTIPHKHAMKLIQRRLDGMLKDHQQALLDEHLDSCDSCRLYASEMDLIPARLTHEFQTHWDAQRGPSQNVSEFVTAKARRIPVTNRISSATKMFAGAMALLVMIFLGNFLISRLQAASPLVTTTETTEVISSPNDRLLTFASDQNGNFEIYTLHPDGSGLTNLTNHPANDYVPFWSPDGKRIAFESDRNGSRQIYLMDADGSNLVQLTQEKGNLDFDPNGHTPWSPDGTKLIVSRRPAAEQSQLDVLDIADKSFTTLIREPGQYFLPSWSPDGTHIAFLSDTGSMSRDLWVVDSQGDQLINLTEKLPKGGEFFIADYRWSPDGATIFFATNQNMYSATVDGTVNVLAPATDRILSWWDGGAVRLELAENILNWVRSDGTQSSLELCVDSRPVLGVSQKQSANGDWVIGMDCTGKGWELYWASADGTTIQQLLNSPIATEDAYLFNMTWSADGNYIAFIASNITSTNVSNSNFYILDVANARKDPSLQPIKLAKGANPDWQPVILPAVVKDPPDLKLDPQSCKPAAEMSAPNDLYDYEVIENTSLVDGDFTFDFWMYCDPSLKNNDHEHFSAISGLGIYSSWRYNGPSVEGPVEYHYGFADNEELGKSSSSGPLYKASASGKFGISVSEDTIRNAIQQGDLIQFQVTVDSALGQNSAILSFRLEPTDNGLTIVDAQANQPDDAPAGLIAFISDEGGNADIYTMRADGSEVSNITNHSANDYSPVWSPDGQKILFVSERTGNADIFRMDPDGSQLIPLTDNPGYDGFFSLSPNGENIIYLSSSDDDANKASLVMMNADGSNKLTLTEPGSYVFLGWSPNGHKVVYLEQVSDQPQDDQIHVSDLDGKNHYQWPAIIDEIQWEDEQHFVGYGWSGASEPPTWNLYRFSSDGTPPVKITSHSSPIVALDKDTYVVEAASLLEWYGMDGNPAPLQSWDVEGSCRQSGDQYLRETSEAISPDGSRIFITVSCKDGYIQFYFANADGSALKQLTDFVVETSINNKGAWSPNGRYVITAIQTDGNENNSDLYRFDIDAMLQDPSTPPVRLTASATQKYDAVWQPIARNQAVEQTPIVSLTIQEAEELAGFDILEPTYLPEGFTFQEAAYFADAQAVILRYSAESGGFPITNEITIYQRLGPFPDPVVPPDPHTSSVTVAGVTGEVSYGVWVYDSPDATTPRWEESDNYLALRWQKGGMSFMVDHLGDVTTQPFDLNELLAIAEGLEGSFVTQLPPIDTGKSNGEWIAFLGETAESLSTSPYEFLPNLYLIHPDGTGLVNLTRGSEYFFSPQWSPNGKHLLFARGNPTFEILRVTDMSHFEVLLTTDNPLDKPFDFQYSWSPNSDRIAFLDMRDGNIDIYTAYADGRNDPDITRLTTDPAQEIRFDWSPDGSQIAFQRTDGEHLSVMVMNADGSDQHEVARGTGIVYLIWSQDGTALYASSGNGNWLECEGCAQDPGIYRIDLGQPSVQQIYAESGASKIAGWYMYEGQGNTLVFMRVNPPTFLEYWGTWFRWDGNSVSELGELDPRQTCKTTDGSVLNEYIAPNPRFSVVSVFCAGGFDLYLADREATDAQQRIVHLMRLPLDTSGIGGDGARLPIFWSPDGRWLLYENGAGTIYLLDIAKSIDDPEAALIPLLQPTYETDSAGQQIQSADTINLLYPVWQPVP